MQHLYSFGEFLNEEVNDFKHFTPLYHISMDYFTEILEDDVLRLGNPMRGPIGICLTRSKDFSHDIYQDEDRLDSRGATPRFILNRELLARDGYRSYPVDEWALMGGLEHPMSLTDEPSEHPKKKPWYSSELVKKYHYGKSQFPKIKAGVRPLSHGVPNLVSKKMSGGAEVEFEERILKDIENLGKYIYALNFQDEDEYEIYRNVVEDYLIKYPHIKIFLGLVDFKELETGYHLVETDETQDIKMVSGNVLKCGDEEIQLPKSFNWKIFRVDLPKRKFQKTKVFLKKVK